MSNIFVLLIGIGIGLVLTFFLRRNTIVRPQDRLQPGRRDADEVSYIRPQVVHREPAQDPELDRLEDMLRSGKLTQAEFDTLRKRPSGTARADGLATVTVLSGTGNKINDIKNIRSCAHLDLKEAKDFVEALPRVLVQDIPAAEADRIRRVLEAGGLKISVS